MSPGASSNPGTWGSNPNKTLNGVDLMALWRLVLYWNWSMEIKGSQSVHSLPCSMTLSTPRITVCEENHNSPDRGRVPQVRSQLLLHEDSQSDSSSQRSNHAYTDLPTPHESSVKLEVKSKKKYRWVKRKKRKQDWNSSISIGDSNLSIRSVGGVQAQATADARRPAVRLPEITIKKLMSRRPKNSKKLRLRFKESSDTYGLSSGDYHGDQIHVTASSFTGPKRSGKRSKSVAHLQVLGDPKRETFKLPALPVSQGRNSTSLVSSTSRKRKKTALSSR